MDLLLYAGKVALLWAVCLLCYGLLLRYQTFFALNRLYLLLSLAAGLLLPLIELPEASAVTEAVAVTMPYEPLPMEWEGAITEPLPDESYAFDWIWLLAWGYGFGALLALGRFGWRLLQLGRFIGQHDPIPMEGFTLILVPGVARGSFSFMKWVVVNEYDYAYHFDFILSHELVHVRQRHSLDILGVELLGVFFWFNPLLWLYKRELRQVHELLADRQVEQRDRYAQFMLNYALSTPSTPLGHPFYTVSTLKHRITMLYKNRTSRWALSRYALIAPLLALVVFLTAARVPVVQEAISSAPSSATELAYSSEPTWPNNSNDTLKVKGSLIDENEKPLVGAAVIVRGTTLGTVTDQSGAFLLKVPSEKSKIVLSYVGYQTVEINYSSQPLLVKMQRDPKVLSEVVVTGYTRADVDSLSKRKIPPTVLIEGKEVFQVVEQQPEYPGGIQELYKYIGRNIRYPAEAVEAKAEGKVYVQFVVNEQGYVRSPRILKGLGYGTDEEALRVVLGMPRWTPARQNGKPVSALYNLPISFLLQGPDKKNEEDVVFNVVEQHPEFPGGISALYAYVTSSLKYPEAAKMAKVEGKVFVRFVVDKTGEIRDAEIIKGLGFGMDEEAIRVVKAMPAWKPGRQSGRPVSVRFNLPVDFRLNNSTAKIPETKLLWIVDGKAISQEEQRHVTPDQIESITVDKSDQSALYGERAKEGVIKIITKKEK